MSDLETLSGPLRAFICYRREDSRFLAHLLGEFLRGRLGRHNVFVDVNGVAPGEQIWSRVEHEMTMCSFVVLLIGPHWQPEKLYDSADWVYRELELAIGLKKPIVPAVHSGASARVMLGAVPPSLGVLADRSALEVLDPPRHVEAFEEDLATAVRTHLGSDLPTRRQPLRGVHLGLSTSEPEMASSETDLDRVRYTIVAIAERLLAEGASIVYGGLPASNASTATWNVTRRLQDLVADFPGRVINYALPSLRPADATFDGGIRLEPHVLGTDLTPTLSAPAMLAFSLMDLRTALAERTAARICIGGQTETYVGRMPGVVEEAVCTMDRNRALFLLGGFGGVTGEMVRLVNGENSSALTMDHQVQRKSPSYATLISELAGLGMAPDYAKLRSVLSRGPSVLKNGLSPTENDALMTTTRWRRAFELVVTGLERLQRRSALKIEQFGR